jgi:hypothetical protein
MWTTARIAVYLTALLSGAGALLAMFGLAAYDPVAQTIDPHPISIPMVVGLVAPVIAAALAAIAAALRWGIKR